MNFSNLYNDNKDAVVRALQSMWCSETDNASQTKSAEKLREILSDLFAPKDAFPLVQCMNSYEPVHSVPVEKAKEIVGGLWTSKYKPYEHQYLSWNTLLNGKDVDGNPMSICVTTGTGSGKTECFMLPLAKDLMDNQILGRVQALFLYPLNALMEDQKERLEELLETVEKVSGVHLTYTVYNGDLPEYEPKPDDHSDAAEVLKRRILEVRGWDEEKKDFKFKHLVYTRKHVRKTPPNILLTNPTMLEYILLRGADASIIDHEAKSLRWIVIDETHTYTGAGAAEMAMLLRRVMLAFGVSAHDIRFATSSATFGNGSDPEKEKRQLKEFISGITGVSVHQVAPIGGKRIGEDNIPNNADKPRWEMIFHKDFVKLDELFPDKNETIEEKLAKLDEMCTRVPNDASGNPIMKVKVHYFYRVPNNGLYVKLTEHSDGAFKIYSQSSANLDEKDVPLIELSRCKHCGEFVALTRLNTNPGEDGGKYEPMELDDSDMFDIEEVEAEDSMMQYAVVGLSNSASLDGDCNAAMRAEGDRLVPYLDGQLVENDWHLVVNTHNKCPYCNSKLTRKKSTEGEEVVSDIPTDENHTYLQKFRASSEFISRVLAPSILDHLEKFEPKPGELLLHDGQQYISFADSRQMAAKSTLKQNLEQERLWVFSTIYHELCIRKAKAAKNLKAANDFRRMMMDPNITEEKFDELNLKFNRLKRQANPALSWMDVASLLKNDKYCETFCRLFVNRAADSEELKEDGNLAEGVIDKYVHSIMVSLLAIRPASMSAPETLGMFHAYYPQIKDLKLPEAVNGFNAIFTNPENEISDKDWRNLIEVFMDYTVRSNQSYFLKLPNGSNLDIFACQRFASEKPHRRPVKKPTIEENRVSQSRIARYLYELIRRDNSGMKDSEINRKYFREINAVVDALWDTLTNPDNKLLEEGVHYDTDKEQFVKDRGENIRFNLANLSFRLYEDVYLCDTNIDDSGHHAVCLRPIETNFKGLSPYLIGTKVVSLREDLHEKWDPFPYSQYEDQITPELVNSWAQGNRTLLWENNIWGENGVFSLRLTDLHVRPNLFIQAEHTAQVDKSVSRMLQKDFKKHKVNILACSTTMEMGVDLGNLEVVMLSSVPPQPANYKQRAGRSGRNNRVTSACITLCGSDAIGLRTVKAPLETIINRPVKVPQVDLRSPQVVQRHVNSYLIRAFGVFSAGDDGGKLTQMVLNYYTRYTLQKQSGRRDIVDVNGEIKAPTAKLGDETGTQYAAFNTACSQALSSEIISDLEQLLEGTVFDGKVLYVVGQARENNERCYQELNTRLEDIKLAFEGTNTTEERFQNKLRIQYLEILTQRLLDFWATSRFTPNANMPVNVLTLDLSTSTKSSFLSSKISSNPSYGLREAIAQYAPGNSVVVDGVAYIVRGIETHDLYKGISTYKKIYRNNDKCVVDDPSIDSPIPWEVNGRHYVELVQPVSFLPDKSEDKSRIIDNNRFTRVSAQLIDTMDWTNNVTEPHLFSVRSNRESGNAKILYYNEGSGFGYCYCTRCGRMVLEERQARGESTIDDLPLDMNTVIPKKKEGETERGPLYHRAIHGKMVGKACRGSNDKNYIRRNMIIGDLVQTDYAEIRIRHKGANSWINNRSGELNLLYTLGIVFTRSLLEKLGKETGAVDFAIMPNGHICIFDTNPGGAGYALQMTSVPLMKDIIESSKRMLLAAKAAKTKDALLDKYTLRYMRYVDIQAALDWILEEEESRGVLPAEIASVSNHSSETDIVSMERDFAATAGEVVLFTNNNYSQWNYDDVNDPSQGWSGNYLDIFNKKGKSMTTFCVATHSEENIPEPALETLRSIKKGWVKEVAQIPNPYATQGVYPIAYIKASQTLYFTNNVENSALNNVWGNQTLYCAKVADLCLDATAIDCSEPAETKTKVFFLDGDEHKNIKSNQLGLVVANEASAIIDKFINYCKTVDDMLEIKYQDEHLKSIMGMVITLQTIEYFIMRIDKNFKIEFALERYSNIERRGSITANLKDNAERDMILDDLCRGWLYKLENEDHINGSLKTIKSQSPGALSHWRELSFKCGNMRLVIYPDGGLANGWYIDTITASMRYTPENTDTNTAIPLRREQVIKFDVDLEY